MNGSPLLGYDGLGFSVRIDRLRAEMLALVAILGGLRHDLPLPPNRGANDHRHQHPDCGGSPMVRFALDQLREAEQE